MISNVPLPHWSELFNSIARRAINDEDLALPWRPNGERWLWLSRASFAFEIIALWWKSVEDDQAPVFWIPDYFCNQSTEPLRSMKATICFYPVADNLQPDWEKCREMLKTKPPNFFTLVHYFGRVGDAGSARKFCDEAGALLIEDAISTFSLLIFK